MTSNVLIIGAGPGLSASLAKRFAQADMKIALAARATEKLADLCHELGAEAFHCDARQAESVAKLFADLDSKQMTPDIVIYNAGSYSRGPIAELDVEVAKDVLLANAYGALAVAHEASKRMLQKGTGSLLFTGASAGVKGYAESAPFAMGKFALRGLCQSLARELSPKNIHVAHFVIDGCIYQPDRGAPFDDVENTLHPDDIAETYFTIAMQSSTAWTWEIELRPKTEVF